MSFLDAMSQFLQMMVHKVCFLASLGFIRITIKFRFKITISHQKLYQTIFLLKLTLQTDRSSVRILLFDEQFVLVHDLLFSGLPCVSLLNCMCYQQYQYLCLSYRSCVLVLMQCTRFLLSLIS